MSFAIYLANTRGMCAGVRRAIEVVSQALEKYGRDRVYVLHEVVHNKHVVSELREKGAHFVEQLADIPDDRIVIFSAHGVPLSVIEQAAQRGLQVIDATCPLVKRIHRKMQRAARSGQEAVVIGHRGHQEVIGTIGQYPGDPQLVHVVENADDVARLQVRTDRLVFATQTTLSVDEAAHTVAALRARFPGIEGPQRDDTCFATQLRQNAIKDLAAHCDLILVVGSKNSSNSNRLAEVARHAGCEAHLIDDHSHLELAWLEGRRHVGISAGASAPEYVVTELIAFLQSIGGSRDIIGIGETERNMTFPLPEI